ncbi:MAG TPA: hypothetical protein VD908_18140 [Cytophagales bacterium]|nr:hypothetical protein [Cytophagales bacterium]
MSLQSFTQENLSSVFLNPSTNFKRVSQKKQFTYLIEYLEEIGTQSFLVENQYVSQDFLTDHKFYTQSFLHVDKYCKRIHFFTAPSSTDFRTILTKPTEEHQDFWNTYVGFVVIRPIPETLIGISLLKPKNEQNRVEYFGNREYTVHIFGHKLKFESLAFQEQCKIVAACATTAIWSMLHKASHEYYKTTLKTPSEITKSAALVSSDGRRIFPNKQGLTVLDVCHAIKKAGLDTELEIVSKDAISKSLPLSVVKSRIDAYSGLGLPIILVLDVPPYKVYQLHAIAVCGLEIDKEVEASPMEQNGPCLLSNKIKHLYAHDDQFGPFTQLECDGDYLFCLWSKYFEQKPAHVKSVVIPVFPAITISYNDVYSVIKHIHSSLLPFIEKRKISSEWSIRLKYSEDYKDIFLNSDANDLLKQDTLQEIFPKYIWVATLFLEGNYSMDLIFDATSLHTSMYLRKVVYLDGSIGVSLVKSLAESIETLPDQLKNIPEYSYIETLILSAK